MRDFHFPGRSATYASNGMCATSHPLAAKVAIQMLEAGGNAVDAAIAGAVLLGLCEPQMTGIGGDCFVLLTPAGEDRVVALNGSGRAPAALSAAHLRDQGHGTVPLYDPAAVTIPGAVDAFCRLSADFGKLGLKALLAPAIYYADAGVPVAPKVAFDYAQSGAALHGAGRTHYTLQDKPLTLGQKFRAPGQADVLRHVAMEGRAGFYEGETAKIIADFMAQHGGIITQADLKGYQIGGFLNKNRKTI